MEAKKQAFELADGRFSIISEGDKGLKMQQLGKGSYGEVVLGKN